MVGVQLGEQLYRPQLCPLATETTAPVAVAPPGYWLHGRPAVVARDDEEDSDCRENQL